MFATIARFTTDFKPSGPPNAHKTPPGSYIKAFVTFSVDTIIAATNADKSPGLTTRELIQVLVFVDHMFGTNCCITLESVQNF